MTAEAAVTPHRLRFAVPAGSRVAWPTAFGRRFLVTVDVEEEFDWSQPFSRAARGVAAIAALPAMHRRLADAGVTPLYFVDHPVAADPRAAATIRALLTDGATVGAQLHPWVNPPFRGEAGPLASFAGNLPPALEAAKLDALVGAIGDGVGVRPVAYRAGRYGLGPATLALLASLGFRVDSSMRAYHDYRDEGGPDYSRVDAGAFRPVPGLLELPLTSVFTGAARRAGPVLHRWAGQVPRGRGVLARAGLVSRVPLTPEGVPAAEAVRAVASAAANGERLLVLSFHSPSLVPGNTPYVRDADDLAAFHGWWEAVLPARAAAGFAPASLDEVLAAAGGAVGPAGLEPAT